MFIGFIYVFIYLYRFLSFHGQGPALQREYRAQKREYKGMSGKFEISYSLRFPKCSVLELRNKINGPQIWILREISFLEPAPKVWKQKSRSNNGF